MPIQRAASLLPVVLIFLLILGTGVFSQETTAKPAGDDVVIADFEADHYGEWKVEGTAFGTGPVTGSYPGQMETKGFEGKRYVTSFFKGDRSLGKLTSPTFNIERKFLNFLIGGGGFKDETCMKLYVDGKEVRQATGSNVARGGSELLNWGHWDVAEFEGKTAFIEIIDRRTDFWGHINIDQIVQSNEKKVPVVPSRKSKVPQYTFPTTLSEQEEALKANPLLNRFHASRKALSADRFRPRYHYVNPEARLNDPNGLCYWQGNWHLFYQAYPPEDTRQHWGHAYSKDLVHWKDLPLAIYPDPEDKCFSGSALAEKDRVIAIYHGILTGTMVAVSDDPLLLNWEKLTGNAVIPIIKPDGSGWPFRIFDPCIWKEGDFYYALLGVTRDTGPGGKRLPAWHLFQSKDLAEWTYLHQFVENDHYSLVGDDGACPYFWPIGDQSDPEKRRHILLHYSHMSGGKYLIGRYDTEKQKFHVTNGGDFNHGPSGPAGVHAPSACPDGKGGIHVIFNTNEGYRMEGWAGMMTLPWKLTLLPDDMLGIEPVEAITALRGEHRRVNTMTLPANEEIVLNNISGRSTEMLAVFNVQQADSLEINLLRSPNKEEFTRIAYYPERGMGRSSPRPSGILIDSTYSSLQGARARLPEVGQLALKRGEPVQIRIFLDQSIVEVFVNGKAVVAQRVYPTRDDSVGVSVRACGGDATLQSFDAWSMKSIYE